MTISQGYRTFNSLHSNFLIGIMKIGNIETQENDMIIEDIELGFLIFPDEESDGKHVEECHKQNDKLIIEYKTRNNIS